MKPQTAARATALREAIEKQTGLMFGVAEVNNRDLNTARLWARIGHRRDGYPILEVGGPQRFFYLHHWRWLR